jgi:hypothetical protein
MKPKKILELVPAIVSYAKTKCEDVEFYCKDATRSEKEFLCNIILCAVKAGANIVDLEDTAGIMLPEEFDSLIDGIRAALKEEGQNAGLVNQIIAKIGEITKQAESVPGLRAQINRLNTTNNQLQATVNNYQKSAQLAKNQAMAQQGQAKIQTQPIPTARPLGNPTQNVNPNVNA